MRHRAAAELVGTPASAADTLGTGRRTALPVSATAPPAQRGAEAGTRRAYWRLRPVLDSNGGIFCSGTSLPLFSWNVTCASPPLGFASGSPLRYSA